MIISIYYIGFHPRPLNENIINAFYMISAYLVEDKNYMWI